jgi:hypothetical protein
MAGKDPPERTQDVMKELEALLMMTKYVIDGLNCCVPAHVVTMFEISEAALRDEITQMVLTSHPQNPKKTPVY